MPPILNRIKLLIAWPWGQNFKIEGYFVRRMVITLVHVSSDIKYRLHTIPESLCTKSSSYQIQSRFSPVVKKIVKAPARKILLASECDVYKNLLSIYVSVCNSILIYFRT